MPTDDYSATVPGGLKLKGVSSSSKISKSHKKRRKHDSDSTKKAQPKDEAVKDPEETIVGEQALVERNHNGEQRLKETDELEEDDTQLIQGGKTEAELRHEERRRKRLDERLKREGTKTHKERVEELNRYLSNLSEHHDMPRIGPG